MYDCAVCDHFHRSVGEDEGSFPGAHRTSCGGRVPFDRGTVGIYAAGAYYRIRDPADPGEKGGGIDGAGKNHRDHITLRGDHIFLTRTAFFQEIRKANRMIREMQYTKQR